MNIRHLIEITLIAFPALAIAQGGDIHIQGQFVSDEPTGNAPLQVQSTTSVRNLSADKLDGFDVGDFGTVGMAVTVGGSGRLLEEE